jgi:hypothetical protein
MRWCFENTSTPYAEEILDQLLVGQQAHVPGLWLYGFLEDLRSLNMAVNNESFDHIFGDAHRLAVAHVLTGYGGAYLELAIRHGLPLATLAGARPINSKDFWTARLSKPSKRDATRRDESVVG